MLQDNNTLRLWQLTGQSNPELDDVGQSTGTGKRTVVPTEWDRASAHAMLLFERS